MPNSRWTEGFLDVMRSQGDDRADDALQKIIEDNEVLGIRKLFLEMNSNDARPPEQTFPVLSSFFKETCKLPDDADLDRIRRGETVFSRHAFDAALVLLTKSLPEGYQAPNLSLILNISGELKTHTFLRLLATLQTVVNVSSSHGFDHDGRAVLTAQKLRLLHAGIRHITRKSIPDFELTHGVPVNQEDLLATVMGFSLLVIQGWRLLKLYIPADEEEDFMYLWGVFAQMMGVHPPKDFTNKAYIPDNVQDATDFYDAYKRRHYVSALQNPDGVALAAANVNMLRDLIPAPLRYAGAGILPRIWMYKMMGEEACTNLGIERVPAYHFLRRVLGVLLRVWYPVEQLSLLNQQSFGILLFQDMINRAYNGSVEFNVPVDIKQLKALIHEGST